MKTSFSLTEYFKRDNLIRLTPFLEVLLICAWAIWVGRGMLDFNENNIPWGREYGMSISTHHFWTFAKECGWCAIWDGSQIGGYPALANTYAAILHPLTMITTLVWGVVNGSKIMIVASLAFAGIAQWWLAHELKVGLLARLWGAMLVIVGGHFAGKLEIGVVDLLFSTAMCSFVFPAVLMVARRRDWRSVCALALITASGILSGQGYVQILLLLSLPAFSFLLIENDWKLSPLWKNYFVAGGIAILVTAVLIIPVMINSWNIHKDITADFSSVQPLKYSLLNFVIDDLSYFKTEVLGKSAIPGLYINFIGWLPVILAFFAIGACKEEDRKRIFYLAGSAALIIGAIDINFLNWLAERIPFVASIRFPTFGLGISIPAIIGVGAYGLDQILKQIEWPSIQLGFSRQNSTRTFSIPLSLILIIPLAISIRQGYFLGQITLSVVPLSPGTMEKLNAMKTNTLQWISPVFGEQFWTEPAVRMGLKITNQSLPFWTGAKHYPAPYYFLTRAPLENANSAITIVTQRENEILYLDPNAEYAIVTDGSGTITPCAAAGRGGTINVTCDAPANGILVVHENMWPGWKVSMDGKNAELTNGDGWMETNAPSGTHTFAFRFQPWDVPLGLVLTVIGLALCGWLSFRKQDNAST